METRTDREKVEENAVAIAVAFVAVLVVAVGLPFVDSSGMQASEWRAAENICRSAEAFEAFRSDVNKCRHIELSS